MNILFRADSSSIIGTGHIMRDLVLAKKYSKKGHNIIFATQELSGNINYKIIEDGYKLIILKSNTLKELDILIKKISIDKLVIDNYSIDYKFEKKLKKNNQKIKILSFDDTYEKHYCDIVLNHNISADKKKYKGLVPKECKLKCGVKYTLLRDEFIKAKKKQRKSKILVTTKSSQLTIFIAMGGADSYNINIKLIKELKKIKNIKVNLVTTTANQNLKELKKYCNNKPWINLYINSNKIAKLMVQSDIGIITPSVVVNEIINLEIPFISIMVTDNQLDMFKYLKKNYFYVLNKDRLNYVPKYVKKIHNNYIEEKMKIRKLIK